MPDPWELKQYTIPFQIDPRAVFDHPTVINTGSIARLLELDNRRMQFNYWRTRNFMPRIELFVGADEWEAKCWRMIGEVRRFGDRFSLAYRALRGDHLVYDEYEDY